MGLAGERANRVTLATATERLQLREVSYEECSLAPWRAIRALVDANESSTDKSKHPNDTSEVEDARGSTTTRAREGGSHKHFWNRARGNILRFMHPRKPWA